MSKSDGFPVDIRLLAVFASLLISLLTSAFGSVPNNDAYGYIRTAEIFSDEGFAAAFAHYEWATYSLFISIVHKLPGVDLIAAAYFLNALFYGLLVYSFISIIREIDDSDRVLLLAAITILVYPQLNEYRLYIIRDIGFWSLSLFSLWQFMVFGRTHNYRNAMWFCAALLLAATFRVEAISYLLVVPLCLLIDERIARDQRIKYGLFFTGFSLVLLILAIVVSQLAGLGLIKLFTDFVSVYAPFLSSTLFPTEAESLTLATAIFNEHAANYSREYLTLFLLVGLSAILLANLFNGIGGPFLIVLAIGHFKKLCAIEKHNFAPILAILLVNGLILFLFIIVTRFLSSRYTMLLCLVLALFVPLILDRLLQWSGSAGKKVLVTRLIAVFLLYCAIDAYISFGSTKNYLYDAADWIAENSSPGTMVLTNNTAIAYFSGKVQEYDLTQRNLTEEEVLQTSPGSFIAVETTPVMRQLFQSNAISSRVEQLIAFPDDEEQRLVVYRRIGN